MQFDQLRDLICPWYWNQVNKQSYLMWNTVLEALNVNIHLTKEQSDTQLLRKTRNIFYYFPRWHVFVDASIIYALRVLSRITSALVLPYLWQICSQRCEVRGGTRSQTDLISSGPDNAAGGPTGTDDCVFLDLRYHLFPSCGSISTCDRGVIVVDISNRTLIVFERSRDGQQEYDHSYHTFFVVSYS